MQFYTILDAIINPFHADGRFLYPLKMSENERFSDVFRGYRNGILAWKGLIWSLLTTGKTGKFIDAFKTNIVASQLIFLVNQLSGLYVSELLVLSLVTKVKIRGKRKLWTLKIINEKPVTTSLEG